MSTLKRRLSMILVCTFLFSCVFTNFAFAAGLDVTNQFSNDEKQKLVDMLTGYTGTENILRHGVDYEYSRALYYKNEAKMIALFSSGDENNDKWSLGRYKDTLYFLEDAKVLDQHLRDALGVEPTHNFKPIPSTVEELSSDIYTVYYSNGAYCIYANPGDDEYSFKDREFTLKNIEQVSADVYCCKVHIRLEDYWTSDDPIPVEHDGYMLFKKNGNSYTMLEVSEKRSEPSSASLATYTSKTATPTSSKVLVNGNPVALEAYNIDGNNYFKLRDLAIVLSDSDAAFSVEWDSAKNAINLAIGKSYSGQMSVANDNGNQKAVESTNPLYIDGNKVEATAYNINGNTYFKLRDLGKLVNFIVGFDSASNTVSVNA